MSSGVVDEFGDKFHDPYRSPSRAGVEVHKRTDALENFQSKTQTNLNPETHAGVQLSLIFDSKSGAMP
jgi:hypothetical protein